MQSTARAIAGARKMGIKLIFLKMGFRPDLSDMGSDDAPNRVRHLHFGVGQPMKTLEGELRRVHKVPDGLKLPVEFVVPEPHELACQQWVSSERPSNFRLQRPALRRR